MRFGLLIAAGALAAALAGCSPALEWRVLRLGQLGLDASLPCKPDDIERTVEMAGQPVQVTMLGCEAKGITFAVACGELAQPASAGSALAHWRAAVLAGSQARGPQDTPFQPVGALGLPQSVRTRATGVLPGGGSMQMEGAWFARLQQTQVQVCHAMVFGADMPRGVPDLFFDALALR